MKTKLKPKIIEQLSTYPVITTVCDRVGVGRATFYRWVFDDEKFASDVEDALNEGRGVINDLAESKVIKGIEDGSVPLIKFWLNNNHTNYSFRNKVQLEDFVRGNKND